MYVCGMCDNDFYRCLVLLTAWWIYYNIDKWKMKYVRFRWEQEVEMGGRGRVEMERIFPTREENEFTYFFQ